MKNISRKAVALAAVASLTLGAAACSEAEDQANKAGDAAGSAAGDAKDKAGEAGDKAKEKAGDVKDKAGDVKDDAKDKAAEASDKMKAEGKEAEEKLPEDVKTLWQNEGGKEGAFGDVTSVTSNDAGDTLAEFEGGQAVVYSEANGAVPVVGKIGETWKQGGALDNEVGLPTAPEQGSAEEGWTQSFTKGQIEWSNKDGSGFKETVTTN